MLTMRLRHDHIVHSLSRRNIGKHGVSRLPVRLLLDTQFWPVFTNVAILRGAFQD